LHKAVRRHRTVFGAAIGVAAVLLLGMAASTSQAIRATRAEQQENRMRTLAETKEKKSEQVAHLLKAMLKGVGPSVALGRDTEMLREIVDKTAERISTDLKGEPEVEIELRLTLAQVYFDLQDFTKIDFARETVRLARKHFGDENLAVADALGQLGRALMFLRETDEAEKTTRLAIELQNRLRGEGSLQEADSLVNLGDVLRHQAGEDGGKTKLVDADKSIRKGLAIRRKLLGDQSDEVAWALNALAILQLTEGKAADAEGSMREAVSIAQAIHGNDHPYTAAHLAILSSALRMQGKLAEAETDIRKALTVQEHIGGKGKTSQFWSQYDLGLTLAAAGKTDEAETRLRAAVDIAAAERGRDYADLPLFTSALAEVLRRKGNLADARAMAEQSVDICLRNPGRIEKWQVQAAFTSLRKIVSELNDTNALARLDELRQAAVSRKTAP